MTKKNWLLTGSISRPQACPRSRTQGVHVGLPVLLIRPIGVGKDVLSEDIHRNSHCASGKFIAVNCAAIRGEASKATNLFHVIPDVTQIMVSLVLAEVPSLTAIMGFVVSGSGVYPMNRNHPRNNH